MMSSREKAYRPLVSDRTARSNRQILSDLFTHRNPGDEEKGSMLGLSTESDDEPEFNAEDICWVWDGEQKSNEVVLQNNNLEAYFHPDYSCGTAAIRGGRQFSEGEEHYWEVKLSSAVYGTDMMIGVGSENVDLTKYKAQFCSIIGKETNSWGVSYFGTLHHDGKVRDYTKKFERGSIIGCHLDLWEGTLSFYKDGEALGVAFRGLHGKKLYPMISSTAARTKMRLLCSHKSSFSLQYLCCRELSKTLSYNALAKLPIPGGLKRYLSWKMEWVFKLNNQGLVTRKRTKR